MTLTIADPVRHTVQQILSWFAQGFETANESDMLAALSDAEVEALADDCGISAHQLLALVKAGPHAADEMPAMMRALNIDPAEVEYRMRASSATCRSPVRSVRRRTPAATICSRAKPSRPSSTIAAMPTH